MGKAMLDPKRDLKGATPLTLARALLRPLRPRRGAKAVVSDETKPQAEAQPKAEELPKEGKGAG